MANMVIQASHCKRPAVKLVKLVLRPAQPSFRIIDTQRHRSLVPDRRMK